MQTLNLRKFAKDSVLTFIQQGLSFVFALGTSILLARILGAEGAGLVALTILLPVLVETFVNFGFPVTTIYFLGRREYTIKTIAQTNVAISIIISLIGFVLAAAMIIFGHDRLFPGVPLNLLLMAILIVPITIFKTNFIAIFQAIQNFKIYNTIILSIQLTLFVFTFLFIQVYKGGVEGAILAQICAQLIGLIISVVILGKLIPLSPSEFLSWSPEWNYVRKGINYGYKVYLSNMLSFLNYKLDRFLMNVYENPAAVGIYNIGAALGEKLWIISQAISTVLLPRVAELKDDKELQNQLTPLVARHTFWLTGFIAIIFFFFAKPIVNLLYGADFAQAALVLQVILPGVVFLTLSRVLANDISARGYPGINAILSLIAVIINFTANIILIPKLSIVGAAWASTISYGFNTIFKLLAYCKISGVKWYKVLFLNKSDYKNLSRLIKTKIIANFHPRK